MTTCSMGGYTEDELAEMPGMFCEVQPSYGLSGKE